MHRTLIALLIVAGLGLAAGAALADPELAPTPAWVTDAGTAEVAAADVAATEAPPTNAELVAGAAEVRDSYAAWRGSSGAARTAALLGLLASVTWLLIGLVRRLIPVVSGRAKAWLPRVAWALGLVASVLTALAGGQPLLVALAGVGPPLAVALHEAVKPQRDG